MPTLNIFVSFEFDKDQDLKNNFYEQAKQQTNHRILNCSLNEAYPDEAWKNKARKAIRRCDVVVVLIGQDTHNAPRGRRGNGYGPQLAQACHPSQATGQAV